LDQFFDESGSGCHRKFPFNIRPTVLRTRRTGANESKIKIEKCNGPPIMGRRGEIGVTHKWMNGSLEKECQKCPRSVHRGGVRLFCLGGSRGMGPGGIGDGPFRRAGDWLNRLRSARAGGDKTDGLFSTRHQLECKGSQASWDTGNAEKALITVEGKYEKNYMTSLLLSESF